MTKIRSTSTLINKFLSVAFWITAVFTAAAVIVFSVLLINDKSIPAGVESAIILGNYRITLANVSDCQLRPIILITIINVALMGGLSCYVIHVIKQIFQPMSEGLPFNGSVSKSIRKIAWVQLIFGIIGIVLQIVTNVIFYKAIDIVSLFDPEKVTSCKLSVVSDGSFFIWFVLLLLLSHVFKYGEQLQQLSDETL